MAKPKSSNVSKKKIESIVLVTEKNRKFCVTTGRTMFVYQKGTTQFTLLGEFVIRPRLIPRWFIEGDQRTYIEKGEEREEYADKFRSVIDLLIKEKKLYIDPEKALIKFDHKK